MALVVIDMQYEFDPQASKAEAKVLALIKRAKARHEVIFVVAYMQSGATLASILAAVTNYPLTFYVKKGRQDGSASLARAMTRVWRKGLVQRFRKLRFCGVYTSMCVERTFLSMCKIAEECKGEGTALHRGTKLELVSSACADPNTHYDPLRYMKSQMAVFPNMKVA